MKKISSAIIITAALSIGNTAVAEEKHYMMHGGDGPQGHMMEGKNHKAGMDDSHPIVSTSETKSHPTGKSTEHVEQYGDGKHTKPKGKHYMMNEGGDVDPGYMMKGDKHPTN